MKAIPKITEAEWLVMKILWERGRANTNEVVEALAPSVHWKPKTIMTLLKRLSDKGALGYERNGRIFEYFPLAAEGDCIRAESRSFLQRIYGGALSPMLAHFLENEKLTKAEIAELKKILEKKAK